MMNRYFPIYHGLHERAPWGIAVERTNELPRVELVLLCRTEQEAKDFSDKNNAESDPARAGRKAT